jgi:hypothetical protein
MDDGKGSLEFDKSVFHFMSSPHFYSSDYFQEFYISFYSARLLMPDIPAAA